MTLAELLDAGLNYQEIYELCCHLDVSHLWGVWKDLYEHILEVWRTFLAPKMNFNLEIEGPHTWQLVTGKDPSWVSSNA